MSAEDFQDTNVLVYRFDETAPEKRHVADGLVRGALADGSGCISYQVIRETMNVLARKLGATPGQVRQLMEDVLFPLCTICPSRALYRRGLDLRARYGFSVYDSLIAAVALEGGCSTLYSEDLQHGQRIEGLTIVNPFKSLSRA